MSPEHHSPVGRLAPSPTGLLHVGHARTFLLAWWHLRSRGGRVLLRLEDLDRARVKAGLVEACLRDLEWLGLDWDGAALQQSTDLAPFAAALEQLVSLGLAYACTCSRRDVERAFSAPHQSDRELRYPGTCRARYDSIAEAERQRGAPVGLRLRVAEGAIELEDGCAGPFRVDVQREVGDFLLARSDGSFAYQLAVVVDDARTGVSEVLRGDDLLASAARQWHLQRALGLSHPAWFHVPLVLDPAGERLAKRRSDVTLSQLRESGVDARALVAWAARSAGQRCEEPLSARELLPGFDLALVPRSPAQFGPRELAELRRMR